MDLSDCRLTNNMSERVHMHTYGTYIRTYVCMYVHVLCTYIGIQVQVHLHSITKYLPSNFIVSALVLVQLDDFPALQLHWHSCYTPQLPSTGNVGT